MLPPLDAAVTAALAQVDVRLMPLPPSFNARPYTLYHWLEAFGVVVFHGKEMWKHRDLSGRPVASMRELVRERMQRDYRNLVDGPIINKSLPQLVAAGAAG